MAHSTAYVDLGILRLLSQEPSSAIAAEQRAMRRIWRQFEEGEIRLITSGEAMETDIILWLNSCGICITDTLRAVESIEEFEWWGKADREETKPYKRVIFYFEELPCLTGPEADDRIMDGGKTLSQETEQIEDLETTRGKDAAKQ